MHIHNSTCHRVRRISSVIDSITIYVIFTSDPLNSFLSEIFLDYSISLGTEKEVYVYSELFALT